MKCTVHLGVGSRQLYYFIPSIKLVQFVWYLVMYKHVRRSGALNLVHKNIWMVWIIEYAHSFKCLLIWISGCF